MGASVIATFTPESSDSSAAIERYRCAYRAAEKAVTFGETIRLGGIVLGGVVLIGAVVELLANPAEHFRVPCGLCFLHRRRIFAGLGCADSGDGFSDAGAIAESHA